MKEIQLNLFYTEAQNEVFFGATQTHRRIIVPKGGRVGITMGAAQAIIEFMLEGKGPILWGDTTFDNIRKYFGLYFEPVLKQLGKEGDLWEMSWAGPVLRIGESICHFRTAQNPYNWEGFGYWLIFLNEAGIILKNPYLWDQAVSKMLIDFPDSIMIAAGVPKGSNTFKEFKDRAESDDPKWADWKLLTYSMYDNPFNSIKSIEDYIAQESPGVVAQEVFGQFVEQGDDEWQVFTADTVDASMMRWKAKKAAGYNPMRELPILVANDPSRGGDDCTFAWVYRDGFLDEIKSFTGDAVGTGPKVGDMLRLQLSERLVDAASDLPLEKQMEVMRETLPVLVDYIGIGASVVDDLAQEVQKARGRKPDFENVVYLTSSGKTNWQDKRKRFHFKNERAAWAWKLREMLIDGAVDLPPQQKLRQELLAYRFMILEGNVIALEPKEETKKRLNGRSPGFGDVCMYAFSGKKKAGKVSWK